MSILKSSVIDIDDCFVDILKTGSDVVRNLQMISRALSSDIRSACLT